MLRRTLLLVCLLISTLVLSACGEDEDEPIGIPVDPDAGTPVLAPTEAIYEPAAQSPDELAVEEPDVDVAMDTAEELVEEDEDAAYTLADDPSTTEIFGIYIPVPEDAELIEIDTEDAERYSKASYAIDGVTVEEVLAYYAEALPEAGYTVEEGDLGSGEDAETLRFTTGEAEKSGLISIVEGGEAIRITISTGSIDE